MNAKTKSILRTVFGYSNSVVKVHPGEYVYNPSDKIANRAIDELVSLEIITPPYVIHNGRMLAVRRASNWGLYPSWQNPRDSV